MKTRSLAILLVFLAVACNESELSSGGVKNASVNDNNNATIASVPTNQTSTLRDDYQESAFSKYVLLHKTDNQALIDENFFPAGSDSCQQATYDVQTNPKGCRQDKTYVIPCDTKPSVDDEHLSIGMSAPLSDTSCDDTIILDFAQADFTTEGLVVSLPITQFQDTYGFRITADGIFANGAALVFDSDEVTLKDIANRLAE